MSTPELVIGWPACDCTRVDDRVLAPDPNCFGCFGTGYRIPYDYAATLAPPAKRWRQLRRMVFTADTDPSSTRTFAAIREHYVTDRRDDPLKIGPCSDELLLGRFDLLMSRGGILLDPVLEAIALDLDVPRWLLDEGDRLASLRRARNARSRADRAESAARKAADRAERARAHARSTMDSLDDTLVALVR